MRDPGTIPILLYHSISDRVGGQFSPYVLPPSMFQAHLDLIAERGHTVLTMAAMVRSLSNGEPLAPRPLVITFDDGFDDLSTHAWPALTARGMSATAYITTGPVDRPGAWSQAQASGNRTMIDRAALVALDRAGCEIGAHSVTHPQLECLDPQHARDEIVRSKEFLEEVLGHTVESFAYPFGHFDKAVRQLVIDAGFTSACGVRNAFSFPDDDRFGISRLTVANDWDTERLGRVLAGWRTRRAPQRELVRTRVNRTVRRYRASKQQGAA